MIILASLGGEEEPSESCSLRFYSTNEIISEKYVCRGPSLIYQGEARPQPSRNRGPLVLVCVNAVNTLYHFIIPVAQREVAKLCSSTVLHGCKEYFQAVIRCYSRRRCWDVGGCVGNFFAFGSSFSPFPLRFHSVLTVSYFSSHSSCFF